MKDTTKPQEAYIKYEADRMTIKSPFKADYVEELKTGTTTRKWNAEKKVWTVNVSEKEKTIAIISKYFKIADETDPDENTAEDNTCGIKIWTDGACSGNPGAGGYAALLKNNGTVKEIAGGFAHTTNNRMEITAAIAALEALPEKSDVTLYSDSKYLVDAVNLGWAKKWRANGWKRNAKDKAVNPDLWQKLLDLCGKHTVKFVWVKGHGSNPENIRCDELAEAITHIPGMPEDKGYIKETIIE